jgi:hypothetical protein
MINKKLLFLAAIALIAHSTNGQDRKSMRYIIEAREATDPYLSGMEEFVAEEFTGVSGVVLDEVSVANFEGNAKKRHVVNYQRLRIKILDKVALEAHSTFSYENDSYKWFGYRRGSYYGLYILKAGGEKVEIDLDELQRNADEEVAIPNLEIGDVVDYTLYTERTIYQTCFSPIVETLSSNYPTINGYRRYALDRGIFVNYKAMNGAPELEKLEDVSDRRTVVYELKYDRIPEELDEVWTPDLRTEPSIKLSICYAPLSRVDNMPYMLEDPYNVTTHASDDLKKRTVRNLGRPRGPVEQYLKLWNRWYRGTYKDVELTDEEYMKVAYYYFRYYTLIFNSTTNAYQENYHTSVIKPVYFNDLMQRVAKDRGIDHAIVYTNNRDISDFDDVIMAEELVAIFAYKGDGSDDWTYIQTPTAYQTMDFINPDLRGNKTLYLPYTFEGGKRGYPANDPQWGRIPESDPSDNYDGVFFEITPDLSSKVAKVKTTRKLTGNYKYYRSQLILESTGYHEDAEVAMLLKGVEDEFGNSGRRERGKSWSLSRVEGDDEAKLNSMKEVWENEEFELESYDSFNLVNSGIMSKEDSLIFQEEFTISELFTTVGPNIIFDFGKVAMDQISFTDEEINSRKSDVFINYPKKLYYRYEVEVPEGYTPQGYESLNNRAESDYGSVEIKTSIEGNSLIIELEKIYKQRYVPADDWGKIMEFITPAMKINESKVVFAKA